MLTRAKSLVVVIGNPLTLLRTEEHMVRKYGVSAKCWSNFLHLCLAEQTFYVPDNVLKSTEKQTQFKRSLALKVQEKIKLVPATSTSTSSRAVLFSIPSVQRRTTTVVESSHIASVAPPSSSKGLTVHATLSSTNPSRTMNSATGVKNTTKLVLQCSSKGVPTSASLPPSIVHQQPPSKPSKPSPVLVPSQRFNPSSFSGPNPSVMTSLVQKKIKLVPATNTSTSSRAVLFSIPSVQPTTTVVESSHIASVAPPSSSKGLMVYATLSSTNPSRTMNSTTGAKNTTKLVLQCSSKGVPTSARPGSLPSSIVHQKPPSLVSVPSQRFNSSSFSGLKPSAVTSVNTVPSTKPPSKRESQVDGVIEPTSYHQKISAHQKTNISKGIFLCTMLAR